MIYIYTVKVSFPDTFYFSLQQAKKRVSLLVVIAFGLGLKQGKYNVIFKGSRMKSSMEQLKRRGYITSEDVESHMHHTKSEWLEMIYSKESYQRTIAVKLLSEKSDIDDELIRLFLQMLAQEKKLYTKIELCDALAKGGVPAAELMVHYLGQIGNNQHYSLPTKTFNKNSYPLPRDIIARTLAHMDPNVLPTLLNVLQTNRIPAIREVVDAIGFICFYNNLHTKSQISDALILCLKNYAHDDAIRWKLVRSFESFDDSDVIHTLVNIEQSDSEQIIRCEARRSLKIISDRINFFD